MDCPIHRGHRYDDGLFRQRRDVALRDLLEASPTEGGLGWTPGDYGFFSGASGLINVFLLMLFFS